MDPSGGQLCPGADTASVAAPAVTLRNGDPGVKSLNRNAAPQIPPSLFVRGRRGRAEASVVIDTAGRVEPASAVVHASTEPAWANAVCVVLPKLRFAPIRVQGTPVRARILLWYEYYVDPNAK